MTNLNYNCPKCQNNTYESGEIRTTGGFWTKIFDIQNKKFSYVACSRCKYTEFFKTDSSMLGNVFDFFTN